MSDQHVILADSALHDLSAAIYLHQGGFWLNATLNAQQAVEKLGKAILLHAGVDYLEVRNLSHRIPKINERIESLGLCVFDEIDANMAKKMQRIYTEQKCPNEASDDAPYTLFDRIESDLSIEWSLRFLELARGIVPAAIPRERSDALHVAFAHARDLVVACQKCHASPCICPAGGSSSSRPLP